MLKRLVLKTGLFFKNNSLGILLCVAVAVVASIIAEFIPYHVISASVFALIIGMIINPLISKTKLFKGGNNFTSKIILKGAIVLMGVTLSINQVLYVGGFSLIVMSFTLLAAFGFGWLFGRIFKMNWKLSSLISAGTGICGGSAIAAISPAIKAKDSDVAYAIAATFIFDVLMVILFPIVGRLIGMSDMGFGLWVGTAVNDTSSVVAAGYGFSEAAGSFSIIVKLTRTLSIIPVVIIFSIINAKIEKRELKNRFAISSANANQINKITDENNHAVTGEIMHESLAASAVQAVTIATDTNVADGERPLNTPLKPSENKKSNAKRLLKIFPWFIIGFLVFVALRSLNVINENWATQISKVSKFFMVMALAAIGMKTNVKEMKTSGFKPMIHGFIISMLVVLVSFAVQLMLGQVW